MTQFDKLRKKLNYSLLVIEKTFIKLDPVKAETIKKTLECILEDMNEIEEEEKNFLTNKN